MEQMTDGWVCLSSWTVGGHRDFLIPQRWGWNRLVQFHPFSYQTAEIALLCYEILGMTLREICAF